MNFSHYESMRSSSLPNVMSWNTPQELVQPFHLAAPVLMPNGKIFPVRGWLPRSSRQLFVVSLFLNLIFKNSWHGKIFQIIQCKYLRRLMKIPKKMFGLFLGSVGVGFLMDFFCISFDWGLTVSGDTLLFRKPTALIPKNAFFRGQFPSRLSDALENCFLWLSLTAVYRWLLSTYRQHNQQKDKKTCF